MLFDAYGLVGQILVMLEKTDLAEISFKKQLEFAKNSKSSSAIAFSNLVSLYKRAKNEVINIKSPIYFHFSLYDMNMC